MEGRKDAPSSCLSLRKKENMDTKVCTRCKEEKPVEMFSLHYGIPRQPCKACDAFYRKSCREEIRAQQKEYKRKNPWAKTLMGISSRCTWKGNPYYKKGITYKINTAELKELWFRDKAYEMESPSIDRIDTLKGYSKDNCRYMERGENIARGAKKLDRWSKKHDKCLVCGTSEVRHTSRGLCYNCYGKWRWATYRK